MQRGANGAPKAKGRVLFFLGGDFVDRSGGIGCVKTVSQRRKIVSIGDGLHGVASFLSSIRQGIEWLAHKLTAKLKLTKY
jgi:hypothetical protein